MCWFNGSTIPIIQRQRQFFLSHKSLLSTTRCFYFFFLLILLKLVGITFVLSHLNKHSKLLSLHYMSLFSSLLHIELNLLSAIDPLLALQNETEACRAMPGRRSAVKRNMTSVTVNNRGCEKWVIITLLETRKASQRYIDKKTGLRSQPSVLLSKTFKHQLSNESLLWPWC